jgi:hypothetical protein
VFVALAPDQLGVRVGAVELGHLAERGGDLKRGQVRAGEERRQVGRREGEMAVALFHVSDIAVQVACLEGRASSRRGRPSRFDGRAPTPAVRGRRRWRASL